MAHGDAVIDGDGVELLGDAAGLLDLARDELAEVLQMDMAGHELGEGVDDGDDRLAEIAVLHAGRAPQAAGAGHVAAMGGGAGAIGGHEFSLAGWLRSMRSVAGLNSDRRRYRRHSLVWPQFCAAPEFPEKSDYPKKLHATVGSRSARPSLGRRHGTILGVSRYRNSKRSNPRSTTCKRSPLPVVRQPGRRGDEFLRLDLQELEGAERDALGERAMRMKARCWSTTFELDGVQFQALNGGPQFKFTEAMSLSIDCKTQEEVDYFWDRLIEGGGEPSQCGWLKDKFGVSWQVVPEQLPRLLLGSGPGEGRPGDAGDDADEQDRHRQDRRSGEGVSGGALRLPPCGGRRIGAQCRDGMRGVGRS